MLSPDKTTAGYAAEIWLKAIQEYSINNRLLVTILGRQECVEFAPMKRLTDFNPENLLKCIYDAQYGFAGNAEHDADRAAGNSHKGAKKAAGDLF